MHIYMFEAVAERILNMNFSLNSSNGEAACLRDIHYVSALEYVLVEVLIVKW